MVDWEKTKKSRSIEIKAMQRLISSYDYSSEDLAEATDHKICELMIKEIRKAKDKLFHIIQVAYELHEESLDKYFQNLRDELDIFSDEIKVRNFNWSKDITQEWMEKLISHDHSMFKQVNKLNQELEGLYHTFMDVIQLYPKKTNPKELEQVKQMIKLLEKAADQIVLTFREREVICNLKPLSLEKTFQIMQDYNRRLI